MLALSPAREPLDVLDAWMWAREPKGEGGKESTRWVEGYAHVAEAAQTLKHTRLVYVGERESDMLELLVQAHDSGYAAGYLLHAQHALHWCRSGFNGGRQLAHVVRLKPYLQDVLFFID